MGNHNINFIFGVVFAKGKAYSCYIRVIVDGSNDMWARIGAATTRTSATRTNMMNI